MNSTCQIACGALIGFSILCAAVGSIQYAVWFAVMANIVLQFKDINRLDGI